MRKIEYECGHVFDGGIEYLEERETRVFGSRSTARTALFKCHCGKEFVAYLNWIRYGKMRSCGCLLRYNYEYMEKVGWCYYIKEIPSKKRRAVFLCGQEGCENKFEALISHVKAEKIKSCGCYKKKIVSKANTTHGMSKTKIYRMWLDMKSRCNNPNRNGTESYRYKNIKVCSEWENDFDSFRNYMMSLPHALEDGYSIDRINSDDDYKQGNVRWADAHTQAANKSPQKNKSSKYTGVSYRMGKWVSYIMVDYTQIVFGSFDSEIDALAARNNFIAENKLFEYKIQTVYRDGRGR